MPALPEKQRIVELRRLGLSEPLVRLSSGIIVHPVFCDYCLGPPYYVYDEAGTPDGPLLVPLWDFDDTVSGVWVQSHGLEFIEYSIESDNEYALLARTEQGFWASRFDFLYECNVAQDELRAAATAVEFQFLDRHLAAREADSNRLRSFEGHATWLRELVAGIDREA